MGGFIEHVGNAVTTMREITVELENCSARGEADKVVIMEAIEDEKGIEETNRLVEEIINNSADLYEQRACELFGIQLAWLDQIGFTRMPRASQFCTQTPLGCIRRK